MGIEAAYARIAPWFNRWVQTMELETRRRELREARLGAARVLIISPPTDPGVRMIAGANPEGATHLICWSAPLAERARREARRRGLSALRLVESEPPTLPLPDGALDVVFANCAFDFCDAQEIDALLAEIRRVLRPAGALFAVYMGEPARTAARCWNALFAHARFLSQGCHPVDILPALGHLGFGEIQEHRLTRLGFPIRYVHAQRPRG